MNLKNIIDFIIFTDLTIRKKFILFSFGAAIWFIILAAIGIVAISNPFYIKLFLAISVLAITLLAFFSYFFSEAIIKPVNTMIRQIEALSEGDIDLQKKIAITSKDEIGTLSASFNRLLDNIQEMNTFKRVIEQDDLPDDIYKRLGDAFRNLGIDCYQIYEVSNSKNTLRLTHTSFEEAGDFCNRDIFLNCNLCRAKKTGEVVSSVYYPGICKHFIRSEGLSHMCIPVVIGDSTGGIIQFVFDSKSNPLIEMDIPKKILKAQQYIKEASPVLEAKRLMDTLKESSLRDPLTGLYNRRFLEEYTETLVASTLRRNTTIGLLMCDLDFFKEVNDTYGHNVGDIVIKETTNIIRASVRASDILVRYGGEEFLAVIQDLEEDEIVAIAEKIRKKIEETKISLPRGFLHKTISIGVCEFPKDTQNFWQAIKFSDIALYKAKDTGRNRVLRFTKDMWTAEEY